MSSSRREEPLLLPLGCPGCGGGLDPLPDDVLFLCGACGAVSELSGTATVHRELRHRTPLKGPKMLHLPFWRLSDTTITPAFNGSRLLTITRWYSAKLALLDAHPEGPPPRGLWGGRIGAADAPRLAALAWEDGDPLASGRAGAQAGGPPVRSSQRSTGDDVTLSATGLGATVTTVRTWSADTPDPAIGTASRRRPAGLAAAVPTATRPIAASRPEAVLFAVPFHREPSRLICAVTGLHLYLETLEGHAELLERWRERLDRP